MRPAVISAVRWGGVVFLLVATIAGAGTPHYHPAADTLSRLASPGQPHALVVRTAMGLWGLAAVVGARTIGRAAPPRERAVVVCVRTFGLCALVAGLAPKDLPEQPATLASRVHVDATIVGGGALIAAMVLIGVAGATPVARWWSAVAAESSLLTAAAFRLAWGSPYYGALERVLVLIAVTWLAAGGGSPAGFGGWSGWAKPGRSRMLLR